LSHKCPTAAGSDLTPACWVVDTAFVLGECAAAAAGGSGESLGLAA
jgi:hypothetical protein